MHCRHFALSLLLASVGAAPTRGFGNTTPTKPNPVLITRLYQHDYAYLNGYEVMRGIFKEPWPKDYTTFTAKFKTQKLETQETADHIFWDACSQALAGLAAAAEGEAYIMMPGKDGSKGIDWGTRAKSHWAGHEYPIICRSTTITKLYRLSAADPKVKEDITDLMLAQRKAGTRPPLSKVTGGGEDD